MTNHGGLEKRRQWRSEEVADGELEHARFFVSETFEREAPFESQRSHGRKPTESKSPGRAETGEGIQGKTRVIDGVDPQGFHRAIGLLALPSRGIAVQAFGVPRIAGVGEQDPPHAYFLDDGDLEFEILVVHQVTPDVGAVADGSRIGVEMGSEREARSDGTEAESAQVEDTAQKEAGEDGYAFRAWARHVAEGSIEFGHEATAERIVEASGAAVAKELIVRSQMGGGPFHGTSQVHTAGREETIVPRIVGDGGANAGGESIAEKIRERKASKYGDGRRRAQEGGP